MLWIIHFDLRACCFWQMCICDEYAPMKQHRTDMAAGTLTAPEIDLHKHDRGLAVGVKRALFERGERSVMVSAA